MATISDLGGSSWTSQIRWNDVQLGTQLKDFSCKHTLPNFVKVTKGQYRNIGVAKSVSNELFLHSVQTGNKVLCEGVKIKEGRKSTLVTYDQKYALPVSYQGWFELLSEDGKSIQAIQGVQQLARVFPNRCLVRENVKGYLSNEAGDGIALDKSRIVYMGEQLNLVCDQVVPNKGILSKKKMLRCIDMKGDNVYLPFESKGLFSPIAGQGNISGVHNIRGLLEKFRLPIMVRLVHGIIPSKLDKTVFTGVFRLLNVFTDETAFVCPLKPDAKMVPISTREPIKLVTATNFQELEDLEESRYFQQRCAKMISSYQNSIHMLVSPPDEKSIVKLKPDDEAVASLKDHLPTRKPVPSDRLVSRTEEDILFEEVDDIYQYVRDGGRPPAPRPRPPDLNRSTSDSKTLGSFNPDSSDGHKRKNVTKSVPNLHVAVDRKLQDTEKSKASPVDESYLWMDPIYDEIEKYNRKKNAENAVANSPKQNELVSSGAVVAATRKDHPPSKVKDKIKAVENSQHKSNFPVRRKDHHEEHGHKNNEHALRAKEHHAESPNSKQEFLRAPADQPVENLRQMYHPHRLSADKPSSRPASFINLSEEEDEDEGIGSFSKENEMTPPPIPPKRYELEKSGSPPSGSPTSTQEKQNHRSKGHKELRSPNDAKKDYRSNGEIKQNNVHDVRSMEQRLNETSVGSPISSGSSIHSLNGISPQKASVMVLNSSGEMTPNRPNSVTVRNSPASPPMSAYTPNQSNLYGSRAGLQAHYGKGNPQHTMSSPMLPQPQYVAVARVGDNVPGAYGDNNPRDMYNGRVDNTRRRLQQAYH